VRARIRRAYAPGEVYFITCVTTNRRPVLEGKAERSPIRETLRNVRMHHPFEMRAYALMPDHIHLLLQVPGTTDISRIIHSLKRNYTLNYKRAKGYTGPLSVWQRGFWDHVIRDERDFGQHLDYIHYNPVKHGYVVKPEEYCDTSYSEYVRRGWYEIGWGHSEPKGLTGVELE